MKRFAVVLVLCFLLTFAGSRTAVALTPTPSPTPIHLGGMDVPWDASYLDLSAIRSEDIPEVMAVLEGLPYLRSVKLTDGDGASPWSIQQAWTLMQDRPELQVEYTANAFGVSFSLTDEVVSFSNIDLGDRVEELKALLPYMTGVGRLDMEYCQVPDEQMADVGAEQLFLKGLQADAFHGGGPRGSRCLQPLDPLLGVALGRKRQRHPVCPRVHAHGLDHQQLFQLPVVAAHAAPARQQQKLQRGERQSKDPSHACRLRSGVCSAGSRNLSARFGSRSRSLVSGRGRPSLSGAV